MFLKRNLCYIIQYMFYLTTSVWEKNINIFSNIYGKFQRMVVYIALIFLTWFYTRSVLCTLQNNADNKKTIHKQNTNKIINYTTKIKGTLMYILRINKVSIIDLL